MKLIHRQSGFTLVEILLYFALITGVLLAFMTFSLEILAASKKSDILHEFEVNTSFVSDKIISSIQQADTLNDGSSVFDNDNGVLSVTVDGTEIVYYLTDNIVYMTEGAGPAVQLTSDAVTCSTLRFEKITKTKVPDQILVDIQFDTNYTNDPAMQEPCTIHTAISLRT